jgi:Cu+-exporting ATPase
MANKTTTVPVKGMTCASCAVTVKKAIEKTPGVTEVNVNLATNKVMFTFNPTMTSVDEIAKNVSRTGYSLELNIGKESDEFVLARKRMFLALVLIIPDTVLMIIDMVNPSAIPYIDFISLLIAFPLIFVAGFSVMQIAFKALIHGNTNMELLIAMGTLASFSTGIMKIAGINIANFAFVGGMIMFFQLLGKYLEALAKGRASKAIRSLLELGAKTARIIVDEQEVEVEVNTLDIDDVMIIRPGEKIPTDGVIIEGETTIDESMATGESIPILKKIGDEVIGGTINQMGSVKVKVTKIGENTFLAQLIKLVEQAQGSKIPIQEFADRITTYFVPTVLIISAAVFLLWFFFPDGGKNIVTWGARFIPWINPQLNRISMAIFASVATLVIACPCALGLATPTALMVSSGLGAKNGILIRNGEAIQTMREVDTIVFDKTGTLTVGKPILTDILDLTENGSGLKILASLENQSEHPISRAIIEKAKEEKIELTQVEDFTAIPGAGVKGSIGKENYYAGKPEEKLNENSEFKEISVFVNKLQSEGKTVIVLKHEEKPILAAGVADIIKNDSKNVIDIIKSFKINPVMLTGDNRVTANFIAEKAGIKNIFAEVLPKDKLEIVKKLQEEGHIVAMVGDGINDAPAIKQANVGIAMGSGSDIAIEAGDIILIKGNLGNVTKAIKLSIETFKKIKGNLFWALFYNIIAIPIASIGFLHPVIAEIAMAFSSINVITNSLRLNRINL